MWIYDEEELVTSAWRSRVRAPTQGLIGSPRGSRSEPYFATYQSDPRPTKAEAKRYLETLSVPFRLGAPLVPPVVKPILVSAPRLAELLIDIDPQDRFRD